jgi:SAM-dependent methyltransferase
MGARPEHDVNRVSWDELAAVHGAEGHYDSEALVAGASSLIEEEERALALALGGAVSGREVLHVQCHLGIDSITLARRGARVTGVDFSPVALTKASELARRAGVDVTFIRADVCELPASLDGRFDLAWATVGILCWIADLNAWMRSVARTFAAGGQLVLIDGHPLAKMITATDPLRLSAPYGGGEPQHIAEGWDYATDTRTSAQVQFAHSLGEVVTAATAAGLTLIELVEHMNLSTDLGSGYVVRDGDGRYRLRVDGQELPALFTLRAERTVPS